MHKSIIISGIIISLILGIAGLETSAAVPNGTPFLQEEIDAIIEIIQDLQDQLNDIHVTWVNVTDKPVGFADDIDNDTLSEISTSCMISQIVKWDGNQWICANESSGSFSTEFMLDLGPDSVTNAEYPQFKVLQDFKIANLPSSMEVYTIPIDFMKIEADMAVDSGSFAIVIQESFDGRFSDMVIIETTEPVLDYRTSNHIRANTDLIEIDPGTTEKFFRVMAYTFDRVPEVPTGSFENFKLLINFPLPTGATVETIP